MVQRTTRMSCASRMSRTSVGRYQGLRRCLAAWRKPREEDLCWPSILARGASDGVGAGTGEGGGAIVAAGPDPARWWSSAPAPAGAIEAKPILLRVESLGGPWAWAPAAEGAAAEGATTEACRAAASSVVVVIVVVLVVVVSMGAGGGASEAMAGCGRVCVFVLLGLGLNCVEGLLTTVASGSAFESDGDRFQLDSMPPSLLLRLLSSVWRFWIGWVHRSIDQSIGKPAGRLNVEMRTEPGRCSHVVSQHGRDSLCHDDRPINQAWWVVVGSSVRIIGYGE